MKREKSEFGKGEEHEFGRALAVELVVDGPTRAIHIIPEDHRELKKNHSTTLH